MSQCIHFMEKKEIQWVGWEVYKKPDRSYRSSGSYHWPLMTNTRCRGAPHWWPDLSARLNYRLLLNWKCCIGSFHTASHRLSISLLSCSYITSEQNTVLKLKRFLFYVEDTGIFLRSRSQLTCWLCRGPFLIFPSNRNMNVYLPGMFFLFTLQFNIVSCWHKILYMTSWTFHLP